MALRSQTAPRENDDETPKNNKKRLSSSSSSSKSKSSSSSSASSSSTKKRKSSNNNNNNNNNKYDDDDYDFTQQEIMFTQTQDFSESFLTNNEIQDFSAQPHVEVKFENLKNSEKESIIRTATRFVVIRSSKNERIKMSDISNEINEIHKKPGIAKAVLKYVQQELEDIFGYTLKKVDVEHASVKSDETSFFLRNNLNLASGHLSILNNCNSEVRSKFAILHAIYQIIMCSSKFKVTEKHLFDNLKLLDSRLSFPLTKNDKNGSKQTIGPTQHVYSEYIPEIGYPRKILKQLIDEQYISVRRDPDEKDNDNNPVLVYEMGSRGFTEVGRAQMFESQHQLLGQEKSEALIEELKEEAARYANDSEEEEEEEEEEE